MQLKYVEPMVSLWDVKKWTGQVGRTNSDRHICGWKEGGESIGGKTKWG